MTTNRECSAGDEAQREIDAPELPYLPSLPTAYRPAIAMIGCGGIAPYHLRAYQRLGLPVVALCNRTRESAEALRVEFFPEATVYTDYREVLKRKDIEVVDIATPPDVRTEMIRAAIHAKKHVLSQKPFVTNLDIGNELVTLANERGCKLAVNQNGRWAPHFSYMREAIRAGYIGDPLAMHCAVHWDHNWTVDTAFNEVKHLALYDFAIHWFDMVNCVLGASGAQQVYASARRGLNQRAKPALLAQASIEYPDKQASVALDGSTPIGAFDSSTVIGTNGSLTSSGPDLNHQRVVLRTADGVAYPTLTGDWFTNGFEGAMCELLRAIEENREPEHSARHNMGSLALCFAAVASSISGKPERPWEIRTLPE